MIHNAADRGISDSLSVPLVAREMRKTRFNEKKLKWLPSMMPMTSTNSHLNLYGDYITLNNEIGSNKIFTLFNHWTQDKLLLFHFQITQKA